LRSKKSEAGLPRDESSVAALHVALELDGRDRVELRIEEIPEQREVARAQVDVELRVAHAADVVELTRDVDLEHALATAAHFEPLYPERAVAIGQQHRSSQRAEIGRVAVEVGVEERQVRELDLRSDVYAAECDYVVYVALDLRPGPAALTDARDDVLEREASLDVAQQRGRLERARARQLYAERRGDLGQGLGGELECHVELVDAREIPVRARGHEDDPLVVARRPDFAFESEAAVEIAESELAGKGSGDQHLPLEEGREQLDRRLPEP
jgi:hypothetical protein